MHGGGVAAAKRPPRPDARRPAQVGCWRAHQPRAAGGRAGARGYGGRRRRVAPQAAQAAPGARRPQHRRGRGATGLRRRCTPSCRWRAAGPLAASSHALTRRADRSLKAKSGSSCKHAAHGPCHAHTAGRVQEQPAALRSIVPAKLTSSHAGAERACTGRASAPGPELVPLTRHPVLLGASGTGPLPKAAVAAAAAAAYAAAFWRCAADVNWRGCGTGKGAAGGGSAPAQPGSLMMQVLVGGRPPGILCSRTP